MAPDVNNNGIPDRIDRIIAGLLMLALAVFQAIQAATAATYEWAPWVAYIQIAVPIVAGWFAVQGRPGGGAPAAVLLVLVVGVSTGCRGPYDAAWRTLDGVIRARDATAAALATHAKAERERCLKAHGPKTEAGAACIKPTREALHQWRTVARPAVNTALQVTAASLQIAERAKADKPPDWMALLRPGACALLRAARAWGHWYPDEGKPILTALGAAAEVTCE